MSDKVELIAAAQVDATLTGLTFNSNFGFESATVVSAGVYSLKLEHEHGVDKIVAGVTRNNTTAGSIEASVVDKRHIQVNSFDVAGSPADSSFFIRIDRVRD